MPRRPRGGPPAKVVTACTVPGTVAITFDDGPAKTTHQLLDVLDRYPDVRVTFFVNGMNYVNASLPEYQAVMARAYRSGHQMASHTLRHLDLTTLADKDLRKELVRNDRVIFKATGQAPRYMRPPFGSVNDAVLATLGDLGYVVANWNVDTLDWQNMNAGKSLQAYQAAFDHGKPPTFIALQHDTIDSTATQLMDMVIPFIRERNLRMVTVAECLGDPRPYL